MNLTWKTDEDGCEDVGEECERRKKAGEFEGNHFFSRFLSTFDYYSKSNECELLSSKD